MAVRGYLSKVFVDAIPLHLSTSKFEVKQSVNVIEYNTLQVGATQKIAGLPMQDVSLNGIMLSNSADDLRGKVQAALDTTTSLFMWVLDTSGSLFAGCFPTTFSSAFTIDTPIDGLISIVAKFERVLNGIMGKLAANEEVANSTGALSSYADVGAAGSAGGDAILIVTDITGTATSATIDIESDSDSGFGTAASEGTFTFSAVGTYTLTMSGTVNRYLRANVTDLGGADDFTVTILVAVDGVTQ